MELTVLGLDRFMQNLEYLHRENNFVMAEKLNTDMMPGDVVCYEGHVAIYIGGGQIVHASNSKPYPAGGIKTNAYYRTIVAVRRYW